MEEDDRPAATPNDDSQKTTLSDDEFRAICDHLLGPTNEGTHPQFMPDQLMTGLDSLIINPQAK